MNINNVEFRDWIYLFFVIFTVFALVFNTQINTININKRFDFEIKTKRSEEFREKFSELIYILNSIYILKNKEPTNIKPEYFYPYNKYIPSNDEKEKIELYERKKDELEHKLGLYNIYLCLLIRDEETEYEFIKNVNFIIASLDKKYIDYERDITSFKIYGKSIIEDLDYKIKN